MQDLTQMLGKTPPSENPTEETENPLAGLVEEGKKKEKDSKEKSKKTLDEETVKQLLMTGDNSEGMFEVKKKKDDDKLKDSKEHEEPDEKAKVSVKEVTEKSDKYSKKFQEEILKHPDEYKVQTPKGEMSVKQAMEEGYNPITKRFEKVKKGSEIMKKHLDGLNDTDKAGLEALLNPGAAKVAPKDAAQYGLKEGNPMIAAAEQEGNPGMPPVPEGAVPAAPAPQASPDLASLLGGGM